VNLKLVYNLESESAPSIVKIPIEVEALTGAKVY
jgi:hypothetical protein